MLCLFIPMFLIKGKFICINLIILFNQEIQESTIRHVIDYTVKIAILFSPFYYLTKYRNTIGIGNLLLHSIVTSS